MKLIKYYKVTLILEKWKKLMNYETDFGGIPKLLKMVNIMRTKML